MLVSLTVGKIDAGVCVLLTEDKRLIEFPSILLPSDITSGSIVDVNVARNFDAEQRNEKAFAALQSTILSTFGTEEPQAPVLRCRNATQTSVVLEWDPISLATANLRSLGLYRNGAKAGNIPRPLEMTSTKISGLAVDTEYTFNLMLRTSAGTFSSEKLVIRTHKMTDLSGITITPGVMPQPLRDSLDHIVERIGAKLIDQIRIDTTHFVCTEEKGAAFQKAKDMNIPVVLPDWILGCEREGRLVGVRGYYLNADPKLRQVGQSASLSRVTSERSVQQASRRDSTPEDNQWPTTNVIPPTPEKRHETRTSGSDTEEDKPADSLSTAETMVAQEPESNADAESGSEDSSDQGYTAIEDGDAEGKTTTDTNEDTTDSPDPDHSNEPTPKAPAESVSSADSDQDQDQPSEGAANPPANTEKFDEVDI